MVIVKPDMADEFLAGVALTSMVVASRAQTLVEA
jgi:hypothetical protein